MSALALPVTPDPAHERVPHLRAVETRPREAPPPSRTPSAPETAVFSPGLPPLTHSQIGKIAIYACEAVDGTRSIACLAMWITTGAARALEEYRSLVVERRSLYRETRRLVARVRRVRTTEPVPRVVEAAVVLDAAGSSRAVALRFEAFRGRWQATSVTVL